MDILAIVTALILIEYFVFMAMVGASRGKNKIDAPSMTGDPLFERTVRVQENTLEQLIYVLPSLWLFGHYLNYQWAAVLGGIFIIGRALYCVGYRKGADKRAAGFLIGWVAAIVLLVGGLWGAIQSAFF